MRTLDDNFKGEFADFFELFQSPYFPENGYFRKKFKNHIKSIMNFEKNEK